MSAETFPLCSSAERCYSTQEFGKGSFPQSSRSLSRSMGRVSVAGPWKRLAVGGRGREGAGRGVVGGRIEVEVGEGRTETEGFPEGGWGRVGVVDLEGQPAQPQRSLGGSSRKSRGEEGG